MQGSSSTSGRQARGDAHLWVPRGIGNAGLLLGLALDRDAGHPDNATATGRILGVGRETIRRWRTQLARDGLVEQRDGMLVATAAGRERRRSVDPLPRRLVAGRAARPTPELLRAAAVVYADAVGWRAERRGCRTDQERAKLAGVARVTVRRARRLLEDRGLVDIEHLRRGRADLRRARLTEDRRATHGAPMSITRATRLAAAAARGRGRSRLDRGAVPVTPEGAVLVPSPMQSPGDVPSHPLRAEPDGPSSAAPRDGAPPPAARPESTSAVAELAQVAQHGGDVVAQLLHPEAPKPAPNPGRDRLVALLRDEPRLRRAVADGQVSELLAAADVFVDVTGTRSPARMRRALERRRAGLALRIEQVAGSPDRAALLVVRAAADAVLAGGRRAPRSVGAVVAHRLRRYLDDADAARTGGRFAALSASQIAEVAAGRRRAPDRRGRTARAAAPPPRPHDDHRRRLLSYATGAAVEGDWRQVAAVLDSAAARDLGVDVRTVSDAAGVAEREITTRLAQVTRDQVAQLRRSAS